MKNMLLIRYRAIAACLYEYIRTSGIMYGRLFTNTNGYLRPAENRKGISFVKLYRVANVISESIDERLLYFTFNLSKGSEAKVKTQHVEDSTLQSLTESFTRAAGYSRDILFGQSLDLIESCDKSLAKTQRVEDLILQSLTQSITLGFPHSYDILFGQSLDLGETCDKGLGRVATAERWISQSVTKFLHKAILTSDGIEFGQSLDLMESFDKGLGRVAIVERGIGRSLTELLYKASYLSDIEFTIGLESTELIADFQPRLADVMCVTGTDLYKLLHTIASPSDSNLLNGCGLMMGKLVGNYSISLKDPEETQLSYVKTLDNNMVSGVPQEMESTSLNTITQILLTTSSSLLDAKNGAGTSLDRLTTIVCGEVIHKWDDPVQEENTLYIRSVYEYEKTDSNIYIR